MVSPQFPPQRILSWHALVALTVDVIQQPVLKAAMGTRKERGRLVPTHKVVAGLESRESLALSVAYDQGVPVQTLARAQHFLGQLPDAESASPWEGGLR